MNKCKVSNNSKHQCKEVTFFLTEGELLAMKNALENYRELSAVGYDVCSYFNNAVFWFNERQKIRDMPCD